jgi:putative transport protein
MVWSQSGPTTRLMSQIGLPLFLAQIGNESYTGLVQSWDEYGSILFVLAVAPILFVALLVVLAGRLFRYGPLTVLSLLPTVAMNTPALINLQDKFREKIPSHVYATVYPVVALGLLLVMFGLSFWV